MKYENIKSTILTLLILVSIILTWNLWTYQPNFDMLESGNTVAEVTVKEKKGLQTIIQPDQVLFHKGNQHFGTTNSEQLKVLMKELGTWSLYDVENYTENIGNLDELLHGDGVVEIIFPDEVPIEIYRNVLKFEEKNIPSFNFNQIFIHMKNSEKGNGTVYFVSSNHQQVYMSHVSPTSINEFNREFFANAENYPRYFSFKASNTRTIFIPDGPVEMMEYRYLPVVLNSDEFKDALFSDPSFVQRSPIAQGEEYTDDSSKMTVNYDTNMIVYVNPTVETNYVENSNELLTRSIDFINGHGGWTDPYRYAEMDEYSRTVTFRLYSMDGFPIFNERGLTEIQEIWGRDEINKYVRPNIALELPLTTEMKSVSIPSGREAMEFLQSRENFKPELLEHVVLGYRMERDPAEHKLILLEPGWFYRYNGIWGQITKEDLGGSLRGLE
nr:two-component system activity regulator YycH [Neobacillus sp. Marseille-Q6967]